MIMGFVVLFVALTLSAVAAWYSVAGLMVLFAAAAIPVAIMASTLEVAKLITASWLYNNWRRVPFALKSYLVFAVLVLMFVTSLGIFGFLSKAHLDQAMPQGDIATKIEIIDEKIKAEQANIDSAKTVLKQMDDAVNQALGRGAGTLPSNATAAQQQAAATAAERNTNQAATLRKNQQKERDAQSALIAKAQSNIQKLREERAPVAAQARTLEAEVGPIKYVAEIIWGGDAKTHFDSAVRFLIITLIFVFDPLAVLLVIAGNMTFAWHREDRAGTASTLKKKDDRIEPQMSPVVADVPVSPNVFEVDSNIKMDLSKFVTLPAVMHSHSYDSTVDLNNSISSPSVHSHSYDSAIKVGMENEQSSSSISSVSSDIVREKSAMVSVDVDIYTNDATIEKPKVANGTEDLEKVYDQIVQETKLDDNNYDTVFELDDGLHRHSGGGTPPGSWAPPPRKRRQQ